MGESATFAVEADSIPVEFRLDFFIFVSVFCFPMFVFLKVVVSTIFHWKNIWILYYPNLNN